MLFRSSSSTTFDVVDDDGGYAGGVIAPGINLSLDAFPIGTNRLQIREDDRVSLAPGTRRNGMETIEVRP